ncbi:MAG: O-methyltransferase [Candidatus Omnitrophica bacterium]|nr:O-methyltransferase [Candidatus Omnitrophota bacterium]
MKTLIASPEIERYIQNLYPVEDPTLNEMGALGEKINFPLVGPLVGRFLYQLAKLTGAKNVFEMGSGFGYSALWFALAMPEDGVIHLTDQSAKNSELAKRFFLQANLAHKARFHVGDALEILSKSHENFDIVFIDIDKEHYPKALDLAKPKINVGGLLIADNLLWFGQVLEKQGDAATEAIKAFNQKLFNDCNFISTLNPIRDGVGVAYKIS